MVSGRVASAVVHPGRRWGLGPGLSNAVLDPTQLTGSGAQTPRGQVRDSGATREPSSALVQGGGHPGSAPTPVTSNPEPDALPRPLGSPLTFPPGGGEGRWHAAPQSPFLPRLVLPLF